jgi:8-oxo-dGTP pyrophosphatase MutT (NUDIX family)
MNIGQFILHGKLVRALLVPLNNLKNDFLITRVACVCISTNDRVVLICKPSSTQWELPGGTITTDDNPDDAVIREVREEANIELKDLTRIGLVFIEYLQVDLKPVYHLLYLARILSIGEPKIDPSIGEVWSRTLVSAENLKNYLKPGPMLDLILSKLISI